MKTVQLLSMMLVVFVANALSIVPSSAAEFFGLGDVIGGPGLNEIRRARPYDVSGDGSTVVGNITHLGEGNTLFRWTRESGTVALDFPSQFGEPTPGIADLNHSFLSRDGSVFFMWTDIFTGDPVQPVRWTVDGGWEPLGHPSLPREHRIDNNGTRVHAATPDGKFLAGHTVAQFLPTMEFVEFPFRWSESDGFELLAMEGSAQGISDDGSVVAGYINNFGERDAFRWSEASGLEVLNDVNGLTWFHSVSADGSVAIGVDSSDGSESLIWNENGLQLIDGLEVGNNRTALVSADGSVIVGRTGGGGPGPRSDIYRWTQKSGMEILDRFPAGTEPSNSINALDMPLDGSFVAVSLTSIESSGTAVGIWREGVGWRTLSDILANDFGLGESIEGWQFRTVADMSDDGLVMSGRAYNPDGFEDGWVAILSSMLLGDLDRDGKLGVADIDLLSASLRIGSNDLAFDVNGDATVDRLDRDTLIGDVFHTLFGDSNLDGEVNFLDFLLLSDNFDKSGGWGDGDFDGSGVVQFADFLLLSENFGKSASRLASVPEPSSFSVAVLVIFAIRRRIRRQREANTTNPVHSSQRS